MNDEEKFDINLKNSDNFKIDLQQTEEIKIPEFKDTITVGTDYNQLTNKPSINNVILMNNKTLDDLNIQEKGDYANSRLTNEELKKLLN